MTEKLVDVHPRLVAIVVSIQRAMAALGMPMVVTDGVRTAAQQQALYAQGRTTPGLVVTKADGLIRKSNHQIHDDGFGHAVDMAFLVEGKPSWAETHHWELYGAMVRALGCKWGGDFTSINSRGERVPNPDRPHMEMPT